MYGTLRDPSGRSRALAARTDVGRAPSRLVRLDSPHASQRHAELRHDAGRWVILDASSTNGTRVNGVRLEPGVPRVLREGDRIVFGGADAGEWVLSCAEPPVALAQRLSDGHVVVAEDDTLLLPSPEAAEATVYRDREGVWWREHAGGAALAEDEEVIGLTDAWRLHLPPTNTRTRELPRGLTLATITLHLRVDRTGEHVEAWLEHADGTTRLNADTHWPVARVLAMDRLGDDGPEEERGWMDSRLVARETGIRERSLDMYYTRIRKDLRAAGVEDAQAAVEARPNQRRLGLGSVVLHEPD